MRNRRPKPVSNAPIAISVAVLLIVLAGGGALVHLANPEATATFTTFVALLLGTGVPSIITLAKLRDVEKQTNGRLHAKDNELTRKDRKLLDMGIDPVTLEPITTSNRTIE